MVRIQDGPGNEVERNKLIVAPPAGYALTRIVVSVIWSAGEESSLWRGTFSIARRCGSTTLLNRGVRTCVYPPAMVMSDKIKPDPAAPVEPAEQVPEWLGNRLRRMFNDVMDEPVPDEFKALLKQLEEKERGS